jgi:hypothetical protein
MPGAENARVTLFEMQPDAIVAVPATTFAVEQVLERADLQRLLRAHIGVIANDVLVVAEEFGAFTEAKRRIDLLGVDREGRLVVIELKRTPDGGHLELQALRYAAMVSAMTFTDLVDHYEHYLARVEPNAVDEARSRLADWLDHGEDTTLSREVRIVLISGGFDREITTTVLWLADVYGPGHPMRAADPIPGRGPAAARCAAGHPTAGGERIDHPAASAGNPGPRCSRRQPRLDLIRDHDSGRRHRTAAQTLGHFGHGHRPPPRRCDRRNPVPGPAPISLPGFGRHADWPGAYRGVHRPIRRRRRPARSVVPRTPASRQCPNLVLSKMWGTKTQTTLDRIVALAPTQGFGYQPINPQT